MYIQTVPNQNDKESIQKTLDQLEENRSQLPVDLAESLIDAKYCWVVPTILSRLSPGVYLLYPVNSDEYKISDIFYPIKENPTDIGKPSWSFESRINLYQMMADLMKDLMTHNIAFGDLNPTSFVLASTPKPKLKIIRHLHQFNKQDKFSQVTQFLDTVQTADLFQAETQLSIRRDKLNYIRLLALNIVFFEFLLTERYSKCHLAAFSEYERYLEEKLNNDLSTTIEDHKLKYLSPKLKSLSNLVNSETAFEKTPEEWLTNCFMNKAPLISIKELKKFAKISERDSKDNKPYNLHVTHPNDNVQLDLDRFIHIKAPKLIYPQYLHPKFTPKKPTQSSTVDNNKGYQSPSRDINGKQTSNLSRKEEAQLVSEENQNLSTSTIRDGDLSPFMKRKSSRKLNNQSSSNTMLSPHLTWRLPLNTRKKIVVDSEVKKQAETKPKRSSFASFFCCSPDDNYDSQLLI